MEQTHSDDVCSAETTPMCGETLVAQVSAYMGVPEAMLNVWLKHMHMEDAGKPSLRLKIL